MRSRLVAGAVRLVDQHGADGLQVRKLAAVVGTSTMAVYTHFSGMAGIIEAVRDEGYRRLAATTSAVPVTDDPVTDLAALALAYRQTAIDNPHLFGMLFRADPDDADGAHVLDAVVATIRRAMDTGRFRPADPASVACQYWAAHHGVVLLEQSGRFPSDPDYALDGVLVPQTLNLMVGFGDDPDTARVSVERAVARWRAGAYT